jgi:hypothetical protein
VLVLLLGAAAACSGGASSSTATATPTATAPATASAMLTATPDATSTPSPAVPTATATPVTDLEARLDAIEAAVAGLRGVQVAGGTPRALVSTEQLQAVLAEELAEPEAVAVLARDERLYRLLGGIAPDADLAAVYASYLDDAVLGLYDPETDRLLVRADGTFGALEEVSYAHEYVHYLQDRRFELRTLQLAALGDRDREAALGALIEGDATAGQYAYMLRHLDRAQSEELLDAATGLAASDSTAPPPLVRSVIEFSYLAGFVFAVDVRASASSAGLEAAFADPPSTTEQVLHPEKYLAGEGALAVAAPDAALLGPGWEAFERNVLGESLLRSWLQALGGSRDEAIRAGNGWGGDAYVIVRSAHGADALLARIAWDDPARDAEEFVAAAEAALDASPDFSRAGADLVWRGPAGWLGLAREPDGSVALIVAPAEQQLRDALGALR